MVDTLVRDRLPYILQTSKKLSRKSSRRYENVAPNHSIFGGFALSLFLGRGNLKLSKEILTWSLPTKLTCIGAGRCASICYAKKAERLYPGVLASRLRNYKLSLREDFPELMVNKIKKMKGRYIRVHVSGDFYNQSYLDKWVSISRQLPEVTFLAYTKAHILDFSNLPSNFILFHSTWSKWDNLIPEQGNIATIIEKDEVQKYRDNWFICSVKLNHCLVNCNYCFIRGDGKRVAMIKH